MRYITAIALAAGALFGMLASLLAPGPPQNGSWEISSVGLIVGAALSAARFARTNPESREAVS